MRKQILIVDDDTGVLAALSLFLKQHEFDITAATTPTDALGLIEDCEFSLAILDLNYTRDTTSGLEGLELIGAIRERDAALPIIVMTGWATIDTAVKAMQLGAQDFLEKPWENARLLSIVNNSLALAKSQRVEARLSAENRLLQSASEPATLWATKSPAMQSALKVAERVAPTEVNVLITGSNGTGKSLLARMMHDLSQRSPGPFISVNTSAVPETLFESEMFGHIKGAFTDAREDRLGRFEIADGGTLFLDEVGNIALAQQAKLLRVLESSEFERLGSSRTQRCDVRIISATNADLDDLVANDRFRTDLLYRLKGVELRMPDLNERQEDIADLAHHFLTLHAAKYGRDEIEFSTEALSAMQCYAWPGNIRELSHAVERAVLMSDGDVIGTTDLQLSTHDGTDEPRLAGLGDMTLEEIEKRLIEQTMRQLNGNANVAAKRLGLSRSALYRRLEKHGL